MRIILGIDPGSRTTGYGVIASQGSQLKWITHGTIHTLSDHFSERLCEIHQGIQNVIREFQPLEAAIEQVFIKNNVQTALKLGQARGAALTAIGLQKLPLGEYSPRQIKMAIVGYGNADKIQIQHMVRQLLRLPDTIQSDAADALAIAICHASYTAREHKFKL